MFAASSGVVFLGVRTKLDDSREQKSEVVYADKHGIGHGGGPRPKFVAYLLDEKRMNLETLFAEDWYGLSPYEHPEHPLLGYSSTAFDSKRNRFLFYTEGLDPEYTEAIGINSTVERLLVYEMDVQFS
jgi:hypothetical protein